MLPGVASSAVVLPMFPVTGSMGCPNGSYAATPPCRVPALLVVMITSPWRFGYDHTCALARMESTTPPGRARVRSCTAFAALSVKSGLSPAPVNAYRVVSGASGMLAAGTTSTATRFHRSVVGAVSPTVIVEPATPVCFVNLMSAISAVRIRPGWRGFRPVERLG